MGKLISRAVLLAALASTAAPAFAQDAAGNWTGFYAGLRAGYSWQPNDGDERLDFDTDQNGSFGDTVRTAAGADAFSPGFCGSASEARTPVGCGGDKDALTYFGMAGFDYQLPSLAGGGVVIGVVAEYGNANVNDGVTGFSTTPAGYSITRSLSGAGNVRGRVGYAFGNTLVYGTGGLAYGKVRSRFGTTNNANAFTDNDDEDARQHQTKRDRWGYIIGGGIEQRVDEHFSIGAMYGFTSLKDDSYRVLVSRGTAPVTNPFLLANPDGTVLKRSHSRFARHDVTVTAAYRF